MPLKEPKRTNEKVYFFGQGDKEVGDVIIAEHRRGPHGALERTET